MGLGTLQQVSVREASQRLRAAALCRSGKERRVCVKTEVLVQSHESAKGLWLSPSHLIQEKGAWRRLRRLCCGQKPYFLDK